MINFQNARELARIFQLTAGKVKVKLIDSNKIYMCEFSRMSKLAATLSFKNAHSDYFLPEKEMLWNTIESIEHA